MDDAVVELLAGPRGRRLCLELAKALSPRATELVFWLGYELDPGRGTSRVLLTADGGKASAVESRPEVSTNQLARALTGIDLSGISEEQIQAGLADAVATAMYWQEPDGEDVLAGWNPDTTLWLTDTLRESDEPRQQWHRQPDNDAWTRG